MIDIFQELKLKVLKFNLKQNWSLSNEFWNEEIPHDYMYEDTYLQLSFVFNTFNVHELLQLVNLTKNDNINAINKDLLIEINNYTKSCVHFINYEIRGETEKYFKKFKNNSCFTYEKKIKKYLSTFNP